MPKRPITAEDLLKLVYLGDPQISPDASKVCYTRKTVNAEKNKYETHLWVADVKGGEARQYTAGQESEAGGRWSPDGKYLAFTCGRDKPKDQVFLLPTDGGEATQLTRFEEGSIGAIKWSPDSKKIAVTYRETHAEWTDKAKKEREEKGLSTPPLVINDVWYRLDGDGYFNDRHYQLFVVDVPSGEAKRLTEERYGVEDVAWSPDGTRICFPVNRQPEPSMEPHMVDLMILELATGAERKLDGCPVGSKFSPSWSPDGSRIAYIGNPDPHDWWGARNYRLYVADAGGAGASDLFGDRHDYCLSTTTIGDARDLSGSGEPIWSADGATVYVNIGHEGSRNLCGIPASGGEIVWLTKTTGQVEVGNLASGVFALGLATSTEPYEIGVGAVSGAGLEIRQLTHANKDFLDEVEIVRPESFWTETSQGTKVHGWVVKPVGFQEGKKYPLVLEIHGGPHTQYGELFFHEFQLLAANGYAVVFSNPRGSKGYGEKHCASICGDWGNTDYVDVMAVADYAEALPYVDTGRKGVMGGSYGGYMTNWIVGHSDRFTAAITDRSVVSLLSMAGTCDFAFPPDSEWKGNPWDEIEHLWQQSPLKYVKNCKTPTMIIHSEGDLRCPIEQGEQLFSAFKRLGVQTRFVRYPVCTSHGLSRSGPPDLRLHRLGQILDWWNEHLKG